VSQVAVASIIQSCGTGVYTHPLSGIICWVLPHILVFSTFSFLLPNLQAHSVDRSQTSPHVRW